MTTHIRPSTSIYRATQARRRMHPFWPGSLLLAVNPDIPETDHGHVPKFNAEFNDQSISQIQQKQKVLRSSRIPSHGSQ